MAMAETVTTLDATGSIVSHEVFGKREIAEYVDNAAMDTIPLSGSGNAEDGSKSGLGDVSLDGSATDRRSGGDWRMYAYYFSATGKMTALVFMLLIMVFGFFNTFPSKETSYTGFAVFCWLIFRADVWLKIWTEVPQTSTTNNAKYVAVYFVLQVLSTMSIGVLILYVSLGRHHHIQVLISKTLFQRDDSTGRSSSARIIAHNRIPVSLITAPTVSVAYSKLFLAPDWHI